MTLSSRQVARLATGAAGPAPWAGGRMMTTTLSPAPTTSTSSNRPPRMTSDPLTNLSAWSRQEPGPFGSPPCQFDVAVEESTDGSDNATH